jgi:hypothetical protein
MKRVLVGVIGVCSAAILALPAVAHHSTRAVFDRNDPIEVTGPVTKIEWMNPHIWLYVDTKDEKGAAVNWAFEMGNPNAMIRLGWKPNSLHVGDVITVTGSRARDKSNRAAVRTVVTSAGRELFGGQNEEAE